MTFGDVSTIVLLPLFTLILLILQIPDIKKGFTKTNVSIIIVSILAFGFSVYVAISGYYEKEDDKTEKKDFKNLLVAARDSLKSIQDTLKITKDTLVSIGIEIDDKTGKILINSEELLKKRFTQVLIQNTYTGKPDEMPDSINVGFNFKNDTVLLYPKQGKWVNAYFAYDTSGEGTVGSNLSEGMGTSNPIDKINIDGRIYITRLWTINTRTVYKNSPLSLNIKGYKKYIIFGEQGSPTKRWLYRNGKLIHIPE